MTMTAALGRVGTPDRELLGPAQRSAHGHASGVATACSLTALILLDVVRARRSGVAVYSIVHGLRSVSHDGHMCGHSSDPPLSAADVLSVALVASATGDQVAFATVYDATSRQAFGLAVRVVVDHAQAEEVVQEAMLEVWRKATTYDPSRGSAVTFVLTVVHRRAVDRVRSAQAASARDRKSVVLTEARGYDEVSEEAVARDEARRVRSALDEVSPAQRVALELAYYDGLTHTEVAARLGVPLGTVKTRLRDGLLKMRRSLGDSAAAGERNVSVALESAPTPRHIALSGVADRPENPSIHAEEGNVR